MSSVGGLATDAADALAAPVPSPCINVCRMEEAPGAAGDAALCAGCQRTLDEIATWSQLADGDKRAVWAAIEQRRALRAATLASRGGR